MRKRLAIGLMSLALMLLMAGCGKYAEPQTAAPSSDGGTTSAGPASSNGAASSDNTSTGSTETGSSETGSSTSTGAEAESQETKPAEVQKADMTGLKKGETATIGTVKATLDDVNVIPKAAGLPDGYVYLMIKVTIVNEGDQPYTINVNDYLQLATPEGKKMRFSVAASTMRQPKLQGTLNKGETGSGWLGYMVKSLPGNYTYTVLHPDWGKATWEFAVQ